MHHGPVAASGLQRAGAVFTQPRAEGMGLLTHFGFHTSFMKAASCLAYGQQPTTLALTLASRRPFGLVWHALDVPNVLRGHVMYCTVLCCAMLWCVLLCQAASTLTEEQVARFGGSQNGLTWFQW